MKRIFFIFAVAVLLTGCACKHQWSEATCSAPKTCALCGEVMGDPAGHLWLDATCGTPKTCAVCNASEGNIPGHTWQEATCEMPKTCTVCSIAEGDALNHSWTDWTPAASDASRSCTRCGKEETITMSDYLMQILQGRWVSTRDLIFENQLSMEFFGGKFPAFEIREDGTILLFTPGGMYPSCSLEYLPPASDDAPPFISFALTAEGAEEPFYFFYDPAEDLMQGYLGFWYEREPAETAAVRKMLLGKWVFDSVYTYDDTFAELDHSRYTVEFFSDGTFTACAEKQFHGEWIYHPGDMSSSNGITYYGMIALLGEDHWSMYFTLEDHHDTGITRLRIERPRVERTEFIKEE